MTAVASPAELIVRKRDGSTLSDSEIQHLIEAFGTGDVTDYQMSALAMAIYFQGLTPRETTTLTLAMRDSGEVVDLSEVDGPKVDKHSTGGVGDKVSICLAPMVAACGVRIPMVSGRGLGHTGGTLDKLEAIPGFRVDLTVSRFVRQIARCGFALIGQTADIAPADKKLYALRDVTGTVESIPLITASILSKKLAEGIEALVLDVKVGQGAFMKTVEDARALARSIVRVGRLADKKVSALLTTMDEPLGRTVGNALETREAFEVLHGEGPEDLKEVTYALGAEMLRLAGIATRPSEARRALEATVRSGAALKKMEAVVRAQKGDPRVVREPDRLPTAPRRRVVRAPKNGYVRGIHAREVGLACVSLGAGRARTDDRIDPSVGVVLHAKTGDAVRSGDPLATLHVREPKSARLAAQRIREAFTIGPRRPRPQPRILETIRR